MDGKEKRRGRIVRATGVPLVVIFRFSVLETWFALSGKMPPVKG